MFSVRKSTVRQDFELGGVSIKEPRVGHVFLLGNVFSKEIKS